MKEKIRDFDPKSPLYLKPIAPKKKRATHSDGPEVESWNERRKNKVG